MAGQWKHILRFEHFSLAGMKGGSVYMNSFVPIPLFRKDRG